MSVTTDAAVLLSDTAEVLFLAATTDCSHGLVSTEVLHALQRTLVSVHHTLIAMEQARPGAVPDCQVLAGQLDSISTALGQQANEARPGLRLVPCAAPVAILEGHIDAGGLR